MADGIKSEPTANEATQGLSGDTAIATLMIALVVASCRDAGVERRSEWSASTVPAIASKAPTRAAGYSAPPSGARSASSPSTSVTAASAGTRIRGLSLIARLWPFESP